MLGMDQKEIIAFLAKKLSDLAAVAQVLEEKVVRARSRGPMPRPRSFEFCSGIVWPMVETDEGTGRLHCDYMYICIKGQKKAFIRFWGAGARKYIAHNLGEACGWQPRKIVRAAHKIDAAIRWACQRCNGLSRTALEVVGQKEQRR